MKLTILQTGDVPDALQSRFDPYPKMFRDMFERAGEVFDYEIVRALDGAPLPEPGKVEAVIIDGSSSAVYENHEWLGPLRAFIRRAYDVRTPMLGVCFGHQLMADALGGAVRKSEKGWGLGHQHYQVRRKPAFMADAPDRLTLIASHQDQVIAPPADADVFLASDYTPFAGLVYRNGAAISVQPHPEFQPDYARALIERHEGKIDVDKYDTALQTLDRPLDSSMLAGYLARFLRTS
jgi:GMP synthase-like glutamine amidotransferase